MNGGCRTSGIGLTAITRVCAGIAMVAGLLIVPGYAGAAGRSDQGQENPRSAREVGDVPFEELVELAEGTRVTFYMWGGSEAVNRWIDGYVSEELARRYGITLERVPMDASVFVNRLITERQARVSEGSIDLMWINGENFRNARQAEVLFGPFTDRLPNFRAYVDPASAEMDSGFPVEGYEAPWGRAQFNFDIDPARVSDVPGSYTDLPRWVRENPGRFTYPQASDFTGSAFIRQAFYALTGGHAQYMDGFDRELYERNVPVLWDYLLDLKPYLWQSGASYPRDLAALDTLFERGEVDITMSFTQTNAATRIANGRYPPTVTSFVMEDASINNTHFVAIAFNARNAAGAMVTADFLLSPDAQYSKNLVENWGDFTVLSMDRLSPEDRRRFAEIDLGDATVSLEELEAAAIPEAPSEYWEALERDWDRKVRAGDR